MLKPPQNSKEIYDIFEFLKDIEHEELWLLCYNASEITGQVMLSKGSKRSTLFDGALFAKEILKNKYTSQVCLVHNHPDGNKAISNDDKLTTWKAIEICDILGYRFDEHLIICRDEYVSFCKEAIIETYKRALGTKCKSCRLSIVED